MSGERPFDDARWPDEEGFADCFMCGKKIDPKDPRRGSYTINHLGCEPLPAHLDCLSTNVLRVQVAFMAAINTMTDENVKRLRRLAQVEAPSPLGV
jgi:hypothetical protein